MAALAVVYAIIYVRTLVYIKWHRERQQYIRIRTHGPSFLFFFSCKETLFFFFLSWTFSSRPMTRLPAALKLPNTYKTRAPRGVVFLCTAVGGGGRNGRFMERGVFMVRFFIFFYYYFFLVRGCWCLYINIYTYVSKQVCPAHTPSRARNFSDTFRLKRIKRNARILV